MSWPAGAGPELYKQIVVNEHVMYSTTYNNAPCFAYIAAYYIALDLFLYTFLPTELNMEN